MCQSLAEGGRRCFSHTTHAPAKHWKKKLVEAKKQNASADEIKAIQVEYLTTEEGIETLLSKGKNDLAARFIARRNSLIDSYNIRYHGSKPHYVPRSRRPVKRIWDTNGIHHETGTSYDAEGYDRAGYDSQGYDRSGYDRAGYDKAGFNPRGFDRYGYDKAGFNRFGLDREGFGVDGWNQKGTLHRKTGTSYDPEGCDVNGYQRVHNVDSFRAERAEDV